MFFDSILGFTLIVSGALVALVMSTVEGIKQLKYMSQQSCVSPAPLGISAFNWSPSAPSEPLYAAWGNSQYYSNMGQTFLLSECKADCSQGQPDITVVKELNGRYCFTAQWAGQNKNLEMTCKLSGSTLGGTCQTNVTASVGVNPQLILSATYVVVYADQASRAVMSVRCLNEVAADWVVHAPQAEVPLYVKLQTSAIAASLNLDVPRCYY